MMTVETATFKAGKTNIFLSLEVTSELIDGCLVIVTASGSLVCAPYPIVNRLYLIFVNVNKGRSYHVSFYLYVRSSSGLKHLRMLESQEGYVRCQFM